MTVFCGTATFSTVTGARGDMRHKPLGSVHHQPLTSPSCVPEADVTLGACGLWPQRKWSSALLSDPNDLFLTHHFMKTM